MKKRNNKKRADSNEIDAKGKGQFLALVFIVYGLIGTIKGTYFDLDNETYRSKGEVVDVFENRIKIQDERKAFVLDNNVRNTIQIGDYAEIWYEEIKPRHDGSELVISEDGLIIGIEPIRVIKRVVQLKINGEMVYKYNWLKKNNISLLFFIGGIASLFRRPKTKNDDMELTDIDYNEQPSVVCDDNLVYYSDMDYSVYKTGDKEIISVVFSDENGAYCRYFTLPDTEEEKDYSKLADLANDIRGNSANYSENEIIDV